MTAWTQRKLVIGSDHGGFSLKKELIAYLITKGISVEDVGCHNNASVDYPDIALKVAHKVATGKRGILICGTGIGMSITANKVKGVHAALCYDKFTARMSREHNNANLLTLGGRTTKPKNAIKILDTWLMTEFVGDKEERHAKRVGKISAYEEETQ